VAAAPVVTFDAGQTLVELDLDMLAARLGERDLRVAASALRAASPAAWQRYDEVVAATNAQRAWHELFAALLAGAGVTAEIAPLVEWLWREQPKRNLFRAPIADMIALARELRERGVRVGVVSNSEGALAELLAEIGVGDAFEFVADSGRLGIDKPDPRIFAVALDALGGEPHRAVHVGDSWPADIVGALGAGWRAVWYGRTAKPVDQPRVAIARDAAGVRAALVAWGIVA
jgi:HAD superfamily hydrolase (TIGR01549 family)